MSLSRRKRSDKRPTDQATNPAPVGGGHQGRWTRIIIAAVVIALIAGTIGFFAYQQYVAPYRLVVITVDDTDIRMDYFLKRITLAGEVDPISMLTQLTEEQIIILGAPQYGIEVSPEEIDETLKTMFLGDSESFSESEFKEWYRQSLNESELSDTEYRDILAIGLLSSRLHRYLAERVPTVAEQVQIHIIFVETFEEAEEARSRWAAGEDFGDLARELSLDEITGEQGGELGWFPQGGTLNPEVEFEAFSLATGNVSQPITFVGEEATPQGEPVPAILGYYIIKVSDKAAARELDEASLNAIKSNALAEWISVERGKHTVKWHGFNNGFDSYTDAWIRFQMAKP
ncbi:MAG: hypothetical protein CL876_02475 [Dehalococcoidales bacterium]|nr:hypothetical protein [Dehalococcoidales bacterium]